MVAEAGGLFGTLKGSCAADWEAYITHPFVRGLGDGTLESACFEHYLRQDYVFLKHFARAYALAVYKSPTLADMRHAKAVLGALLGVGVYTGHQGGFASLMDLQTGDIVWFNNLALAQGNMRDDDGAKRLVEQLLDGLVREPAGG